MLQKLLQNSMSTLQGFHLHVGALMVVDAHALVACAACELLYQAGLATCCGPLRQVTDPSAVLVNPMPEDAICTPQAGRLASWTTRLLAGWDSTA